MNASLSILSNCNAINSLPTTGFKILKQRKRIVKITDNKELMCYFFFAKKKGQHIFLFFFEYAVRYYNKAFVFFL